MATHGVTLTWPPSPTAGVTGYNVYKFTGACAPGVAFSKLASTVAPVMTYTDSAVVPGGVYCYTETAVSLGGESDQNGQFQAEIPTYTPPTIPAPPGAGSGVSS
jgi:hypothetical protein